MIPIRDATEDDLPSLLAMGEKFVELAWSRVGVEFDRASCEELLRNLIAQPACILLVSDDLNAMIGAVVHPWHFNQNVSTATELFWWAEPGTKCAKSLWEAAEYRAALLGAKTFNMASQHHLRSAAIGRLYERNGYQPSEHIYIREIA